MNRKDTIIVAVLLNVIVLSLLFVLAINTDDSEISDSSELAEKEITENKLPTKLPAAPVLMAERDEPSQDVKYDLILTDLDTPDEEPLSRDDEWSMFAQRPEPTPEVKVFEDPSSDNILEIVVKKGDSLDRIAKANGTTVQSIRTLNSLKNDHLKIGQVLNVDVGSAKKASEQRSTAQALHNPPKRPSQVAQTEPVYYIVKSGDSPWKIAKQFHVNMDELLKLNNLNEEKARNLKVGDRIRVQ